jgi:hypothetical protein
MKQRRLPLTTAEEDTARALAQVEENADVQWLDVALEAVRQTCLRRGYFICDDVWEIGELPSTREDRALGPVMKRAANNKWCVKTDRMRKSIRSHLSGKPVWRSMLFSGDAELDMQIAAAITKATGDQP